MACKGGEKTLRRIEIGSSELEDRRIDIVLVADEIDWQRPENTLYGFGGCIAPEKFAHLESLLKKKCYLRTWDNHGRSMDYGPYPCYVRVVVDEGDCSRSGKVGKKYSCEVLYSPPDAREVG